MVHFWGDSESIIFTKPLSGIAKDLVKKKKKVSILWDLCDQDRDLVSLPDYGAKVQLYQCGGNSTNHLQLIGLQLI